jgi:UPF0755 protein
MKSNKSPVAATHIGVFFLVLAVFLGSGWLWWADATGAINPEDTTSVSFTINKGDGARVIAANLADDKLIRSPTAFFLLVKLLGIERNLQAGEFSLSPSMDTTAIAKSLTHGTMDVRLTTLEGWRIEEVAARVARDVNIPEGEFLKAAREGYMFPDTYQLAPDATVGAVAKIFSDNFNSKITSTMREDAKKQKLTLAQVITLASIVEREGRTSEDRPIIAGILLNRLEADWPLQVDATLQYALGYQTNEKSWWKKYLSDDDRHVNSPYNTYMHTGLPPGPICNPGLAAITAVIYPQKTDYWYYIHDPAGNAHYAKTIEEHNANIAKYLQ